MTVVVVNHDGLRHLDACFESILAQEVAGGLRAVMVDNGSVDGSVAHVREKFPAVEVVVAGRNLGFAGGNNLALRRLETDYAVLLNNDTVTRSGALAALVAAADAEPKAGAVQAKLVFADPPGVLQSTGTLLLSDGSGGDRGFGEPDDGRYAEREEVFAACGAAVLYRAEALRDAGLFDESFFLYYEDLDLGWRQRLRGWKALYEPAAVVVHAHSATAAAGSPLVRFHADRNRLLMVLRNAPWSFVAGSYRSLGARATGAGGSAPGRSRTRVLFSFLARAPGALLARMRIRARRKVTDAEVLRWVQSRERWDTR